MGNVPSAPVINFNTNFPPIDRMQKYIGRWVGMYGPHGPELIESTWDSSQFIFRGIKLTGDNNVPETEVTFEINLYTGIARGRIANIGFVNPRWTNGRALFPNDSIDDFAFEWEGCGYVRFIRVLEDFIPTTDNMNNLMRQNWNRLHTEGAEYYLLRLIEALGMPEEMFVTHTRENPVKREVIAALEVIEYKECGSEPDSCSICICNLSTGDKVRNLPCKHLFHQECIDKWFELQSFCPLCKRTIA